LKRCRCKIWYIESEVTHPFRGLPIEDANGELLILSIEELYDALKVPNQELNIEVVFINTMQYGQDLANVFKRLGVQ